MKDIFKKGAISSDFIAKSISNHQYKIDIGAHDIFLGQVREDVINGQKVESIEYSAYKEMANKEADLIREEVFKKFSIICMHIYHSIGVVKAGGICLFVFVSSKRRKDAYNALEYTVEAIKEKLPVYGKVNFKDNTHKWKKNT